MVEYGMKLIDAIRSATINAAELLGRASELGIIAKGAWADIIAVPGDPAKDVTLLEKPAFIMKNGQVYKR